MKFIALIAVAALAGMVLVQGSRGDGGGGGGNGGGAASAPSGLLSYDDFGPASEMNGLDTGIGWNSFWGTHDPNGFNTSNKEPMGYMDLKVSGAYGINTAHPNSDGDQENGHVGRLLDATANGPYVGYLSGDGKTIGKSGTTLWLSCLMQKDGDDDAVVRLGLGKMRDANCMFFDFGGSEFPWHIGYFGPGQQAATTQAAGRFWGLQYGGNVVYSTKAIVAQTAALLVLKMEFKGKSGKLSLWVNPDSIGGDAPAKADVTGSVGDMGFDNLVWSGAKSNRIGEIRIGTSYAAVTPRDLPVVVPGTMP